VEREALLMVGPGRHFASLRHST